MKILFLTDRLPYPLNSGAAIRTFNLMKALAQWYELFLISTSSSEEITTIPEPVRELCSHVELAYLPILKGRKRLFSYLLSNFNVIPWMVSEFSNNAILPLVRKVIKENKIDCVQAELLNMTQYLPWDLPVKKIYSSHNVEFSLFHQRFKQNKSLLIKAHSIKEFYRTRAYELSVIRKSNLTITVTKEDRQRFIHIARKASIESFPITVDCNQWSPTYDEYQLPTIVFAGTLFWYPNTNGIFWFLENIFPKIKEKIASLQFIIVGKDPTEQLLAFNNKNGVKIYSSVPDMQPFLKKATVFIVPLLMGGGMRVKILEALSRGMAVVTTSLGCEGIDVRNGKELVIANTPEKFSSVIIDLLSNKKLRDEFGVRGRKFVCEHYNWDSRNDGLKQIYSRLI